MGIEILHAVSDKTFFEHKGTKALRKPGDRHTDLDFKLCDLRAFV